MNDWRKSSLESAAVHRARVRGCLLGGALGDALGYAVEFSSLDRIRADHGPRGLTGLVPDGEGVVGRVSDDTQMTLFTVEGLRTAARRARLKGIGGAETALVRQAYGRWLETQQRPGPAEGVRSGLLAEPWLYARRAPGNACLSGLAQEYVPDPWAQLSGAPGPVNPGSKGCGTVMRSAPFGLAHPSAPHAFTMAAHCAQTTHGHPTGYYAAGALAAVVAYLLSGESVEAATLRTLRLLARHPGHEETSAALNQALDLAADGEPGPEKVERLGAGWVAEEALAIGVYAALATRGVADALLLSVNHSGDSDSTGSICGNILGARHGDVALPQEWLERVEGRAVIAALADDLAAEVVHG
ncbi:ADP-ribosylglycohydrolase [Streptomyces sp. yr375]|uniref:ADP-ribosylglycohydrolase family protein n=1 Tax=Streptomyces sp. yr375 TaxID=1761906 RepID=UPI0008B67B7B|nr:ADP-ribosylglycohydrolase family protein [Streptomyces sp. yr375]SEQ12945.1 ADP-ribosylglycohydrolase [Streptomyces sp. yr375]